MKGSYFPISGDRGAPSPRVEDYRPEEPYLLLPIGFVSFIAFSRGCDYIESKEVHRCRP